ncbi:hypothetical protein G6O69_09375 [Pseudenhygromyxa sp. WMMC2535]|nr:hypothetical protein [Pseudenhygromyxa sp. WMMC2535]
MTTAFALATVGCRCGVEGGAMISEGREAAVEAARREAPVSPYGEPKQVVVRKLVIADASQLDDPDLDLSAVEELDLAMSEIDGQERPLPLPLPEPDPEPGADTSAGAPAPVGPSAQSDQGEQPEQAPGPVLHPRCEGLDLHDVAARAPKLRSLRISGCQAALHAGLSAFGERLEALELVDVELDAVTVARLSQLHGLDRLTLTRVSAEADALKPLARNIAPSSVTLRELANDSPVAQIFTMLRGLQHIRIEGPWAGHNTMILVGKARELETLAVLDTGIGNFSLHQLKPLDKLHRIEWRGLGFTDYSPQYIHKLPIDELVCHCPRFGDRGLHLLRLLPALRVLELPRSDISSAGLAELVELQALEALTIRYRDLDGQAFTAFASLPRLRRLILGPGRLEDPQAPGLDLLVGLRELELDLEGFDDRSARQLATLTKLERLLLGGTSISDEGLESLAELRNLRVLELHHTRVTKQGLSHLAGLTHLEVLELDHTDLVDEGVEQLSGLSNLRDLRLDHTLITDAALPHLLGLKKLERLNLAGTVVTVEGVSVLEGLPELEAVNLEGTRALGER